MLGITRNYHPATAQSPTYPPPPLKPIAVPAPHEGRALACPYSHFCGQSIGLTGICMFSLQIRQINPVLMRTVPSVTKLQTTEEEQFSDVMIRVVCELGYHLSGQCSDHSLREARIGSGQCSDRIS
eukprot:sb/3475554/